MNLDRFYLTKKVKDKLKDKKKIKQELLSGKTVQEILEFSEEVVQEFYQAAYRLFEHHRLLEAADAFLFLATLNPYHHDYWLGLGMSLQLMQKFEEAIDAYEMAAYCEIHNPVPYFYLANCLFALHDRGATLQALEMAIEYSEDMEEYQELKEQALKARRLLHEEEGI